LAGPNGTPLIGELPAPADPAGGVSCAYARPGAKNAPSSRTRMNAELRDIVCFPGCKLNLVGVAGSGGEDCSFFPNYKTGVSEENAGLVSDRNA
jgi:hypothetical protein